MIRSFHSDEAEWLFNGQPTSRRFRICFVWRDGEAHDVEIVDYH